MTNDTDSYFPVPVHYAGLVGEVSNAVGLPIDGIRMRQWHVRDGLDIGVLKNARRRLYSDFDILTAVLICALSNHGVSSTAIIRQRATIQPEVEWAMRQAVQNVADLAANIDIDTTADVFVVAGQFGNQFILKAGSGEPMMRDARRLTSIAGLPITVLNLSVLAQNVRRAMLASPNYRKPGEPA